MSATDELLANNAAYAAGFDQDGLPLSPARKIAVLACMDSRLNVFEALGLRIGDAHVIRNAGGAVTDDAIRSLTLSQRLMGTEEIIVIHHTGCGMLGLSEEDFKSSLREETGSRPQWSTELSSDLEDNVRRSIAEIKASPFIPNTGSVRGFVYDVDSGHLREIV